MACEPSCAEHETCCADRCVNAATDPENCGACGETCDPSAGQICATAGAPQPTCANVDWVRWPMPDSTTASHPPLYQDNGDGTVTDLVTGLMWQQAVDEGTYTWAQARAYCSITLSNVELGGHHDWRLPSYIELISLLDYGVWPGPLIEQAAFPSTPAVEFWSATPIALNASGSAYTVMFDSGSTSNSTLTTQLRVRCVR
jgi:hypothetical protein